MGIWGRRPERVQGRALAFLTGIKAPNASGRHCPTMNVASLLEKYDTRVPRYTSYPTAPHFSAAVSPDVYAAWLAELPREQPLSLYLHVPFCEQLCLYCGCTTSVVRRQAPRIAYAEAMAREIDMVADAIARRPRVTHIHWGGGTPTSLPAESLRTLMRKLRQRFDVADNADIAVELDPRHLPVDRLRALADIGITRASLGVQDFAPEVQRAVGRVQSAEITQSVADRMRRIGIESLNLDLMYGLPYQTPATVAVTARRALDLRPDRIAVFGYAHVPWMKRHQRLLPEASLPGASERYEQRESIARTLQASGYVPIGLDHFARPDDKLARAAAGGALRRNFQGYTEDTAPVLIGFGASAIGSFPLGYAQNQTRVPEYVAALAHGVLPIARGIAMTAEDRLRRDVIEQVMCRLSADLVTIAATHGADPAGLLTAGPRLAAMQEDGLIRWNGRVVEVTPAGRPFVRSVAAAFDTYLTAGEQRHATSV
jgi:oxygen-independent coproporphyrinogen III oxidase